MLITRLGIGPATVSRGAVRSRAALVPLLLLLAALALRAPGFMAAALDPDEGLYMVQAAAWHDGGWPWIAVWDMHPPGAPALLALVHALVPEPVIAMRLAGALAVAATAIGLHALARRLGAGAGTALAAGLLYVAHSVVLGGLATNTEILFAPFIVLAAWLLLGETLAEAPPRIAVVLTAGLAAGCALFIKQVSAVESAALWLTMVGIGLGAGRIRPGRLVVLALVFAAGAGFPTLATAAGYWWAGHGDLWVQANLVGPLRYGGLVVDGPGPRRGVLGALPHLGWLGLAALGLLAAPGEARRLARLLLPWLAAAGLAVVAPWKFYDHYFLILLPPLCLLAALGLAALARRVLRARFRRRGVVIAVALLAAMPVMEMLLPRLAGGLGLRGEDPARQVARLAADALAPGEALYIANWHPIAYLLAGQPPPTRFAFPGHLAGHFARLTGVDADAELARVLALPPGAIVVAPARWWQVRPEARAAIEAALARGYVLAGTVADGTGPVEVWRRR
jgi:4-amino-4-deoxy-L-arabinose transferase-like glycosyltransferase